MLYLLKKTKFPSFSGELTKPTSQQELNSPQLGQDTAGSSPGNPFDEAPFMPTTSTEPTHQKKTTNAAAHTTTDVSMILHGLFSLFLVGVLTAWK